MSNAQIAELTDHMWGNILDGIVSHAHKEGEKNNQKLKDRFPRVYEQDDMDRMNGWFETRMREAFDVALQQMGDQKQMILVNPTSTLADFLNLFCDALLQAVETADRSDLEKNRVRWSEEDMQQITADTREKFSTMRMFDDRNANQVAQTAMQESDWTRAEQIVRGSLAIDSRDVEMINNLFTIGCLAGKPECIVDARNMGKPLEDAKTVKPGTLSTYHMSAFLELVVVQNILLGSQGQNRSAGGIILPGPPQPPSMDELKQLSQEISEQSAATIHEELAKSGTWTVDGFLMMCRRVVTETCRIKAQFRGLMIKPWFKGDPNPVPEQLRDRVQQIEKFD